MVSTPIIALALAAVIPSIDTTPRTLRAEISQQDVRRHVEILCSPEFGGRLTLQPGEMMAARYLAGEFARFGLQEGRHRGYIHRFDITVNSRHKATGNTLILIGKDGQQKELTVGRDFHAMVGSKDGTLIEAPLVWVGWGTDEDYAKVKAEGKIVVGYRGTPTGRQDLNRTSAQKAKQNGAIGIIYVGGIDGQKDLARPTRRHGVPADLGLVAVNVSQSFMRDLTGVDFETARKSGLSARELPITAKKQTAMEPHRGQGLNVIGTLPGNDPVLKDEVIIIGAHYDHLGYGEVGSRNGNEIIHPGADDNASGVAGVLELAEYFASTKSNKRTIIFQLYSGEEVGLVGAFAYARDFAAELPKVTAMLNMDMIGRVRDGNVIVYGASTSREWNDVLSKAGVPGIKLNGNNDVMAGSDHFPFAQRQVPVLFFHSGLTPEYHTEKDTVDTLNFPDMIKVIEAVKLTAKELDNRPKLAWNPDAQIRPRGGQQRQVRLGLTPDMSSSGGQGVLVQGVAHDSPAAIAGVRAGDRVIELAGRKITSMEDLQAAFGLMRAGTATKITVIRNGQTLTFDITPA
ncbi:MAG: M28 family peptidase [Fimbriimonadaceae bacterium]|jgi:hypothetical protein|nr:M28 family peptidase [Fimbriimonadaceae bacterium]